MGVRGVGGGRTGTKEGQRVKKKGRSSYLMEAVQRS